MRINVSPISGYLIWARAKPMVEISSSMDPHASIFDESFQTFARPTMLVRPLSPLLVYNGTKLTSYASVKCLGFSIGAMKLVAQLERILWNGSAFMLTPVLYLSCRSGLGKLFFSIRRSQLLCGLGNAQQMCLASTGE